MKQHPGTHESQIDMQTPLIERINFKCAKPAECSEWWKLGRFPQRYEGAVQYRAQASQAHLPHRHPYPPLTLISDSRCR